MNHRCHPESVAYDIRHAMIEAGLSWPVVCDVEYLEKDGTQANIDALRRDLKVLNDWLS